MKDVVRHRRNLPTLGVFLPPRAQAGCDGSWAKIAPGDEIRAAWETWRDATRSVCSWCCVGLHVLSSL